MKWTQRLTSLTFLWCLFFNSGLLASTDSTPRVVFVNPGHADESFWQDVDDYAKAAAKALNIDLEIIHGERDTELMQQRLSERVANGKTPDYVILVNEAQTGRSLLQSLSQTSSHVVFTLNNLTPDELVEIQREPEWQQRLLPGVFPNNFRIGYLTAQALYRQGGQHAGEALLLSGDSNTPASIQRKAGALAFIEQVGGLDGVRHGYGEWQESSAYAETNRLLSLYPNIRYIWTANDHMAYGAQRALKKSDKVIGEEAFISTINTSTRVLNELEQGNITVLGGGHFTAVGLTLVKIHQHRTGKLWPQRTKFTLFHLIEPDTTLFHVLLDKQWNNIDFRAIDLSSNPIDPYLQRKEE
ncbi:ABC transporter substrate-binding protein [Vibrio cionasavignyae]|uniref:ABC transporter substrate-binding protein n=1 Tax=Vibrio cionasavignyae TaxID=2910252 RepID=UPI003D14DDDB